MQNHLVSKNQKYRPNNHKIQKPTNTKNKNTKYKKYKIINPPN